MNIKKIISGGQTGVDRAALDFALENMIDCGGYCPKGRRAEDGVINPKYPLTETRTIEYAERTEMNVVYSDATLLIMRSKILAGGSKLTFELTHKYNKALLILNLNHTLRTNKRKFKNWTAENHIETLNIAGPRESTEPGIYAETIELLTQMHK